MKKNNFYLFIILVTMGLLVSSCKKDDPVVENAITITIDEPVSGETITDCADVHIHIDVDATVENHSIEVILHPEGDVNNKILDLDLHEHDKEVHIVQEVDLCSFAAGTCFHLEVEACLDHDCERKETADVEFCLQ